jgi:hypothetical protein
MQGSFLISKISIHFLFLYVNVFLISIEPFVVYFQQELFVENSNLGSGCCHSHHIVLSFSGYLCISNKNFCLLLHGYGSASDALYI